MLISNIKSRPVYERLAIDGAGRRHLVLSDAPRPLGEVIDGTESAGAPLAYWVVAGTSAVDGQPQTGPAGNAAEVETRAFRAAAHLFDRLTHRLGQETVGLRLYAVGEEGFIWEVAKLARAAGLETEECRTAHAGSLRRRVFCVHCKTITEGVTTSLAACAGCGAQLVVRDHFSRSHAAFMGVQADAEAPGDLPPVEELFP
ncbi:dimethylamine monooxygenase subunit DmmA family protein [Ancylobacter sp. WKF20]|uniref:dimethylamine monooxygenase subunit DmmA family protein n=1 Tax=Ancylobacter sp. WKF20 TaxID=3039801 RepID=UPI0024342F21|nr:dimethylamine monooxygenase subunit DmmA family protein [Ancylobacter sp. WKF20]WGD28856.1 dimethylamine monooxygenase subunit DmmA family protein [Ancylobacter sp. WKF20]